MGSRFDWYTVELERILKGHVPLECLQELQTETRAHLEASRDALIAKGCDPSASEIEAIKVFGPPWRLASSALSERGSKPGPWSVWLVAALALAVIIVPLWGRQVGFFSSITMIMWGPVVLWTAFVVAGLWSRRSLWLPVSATLTAGSALMAAVMCTQIVDLSAVGGIGTVDRSSIPKILGGESFERSGRSSLIAEFKKSPKEAFRSEAMLNAASEELWFRRDVYVADMAGPAPDRDYSTDEARRPMLDPQLSPNFRKNLVDNASRHVVRLESRQRARDQFYGWVRAAETLPNSASLWISAQFAFGMAAIEGGSGLVAIWIIRRIGRAIQWGRMTKRALA